MNNVNNLNELWGVKLLIATILVMIPALTYLMMGATALKVLIVIYGLILAFLGSVRLFDIDQPRGR